MPLEMNATRTTTISDIVPNRANGYSWRNGKQQNAEVYFALRPSGAFLSTVLDLAKWDAALYTDRVLKKSVRDQMWTPVKLNNGTTYDYGFGWELGVAGGHRQVSHGGSLPGFRAAISRFVDDKLTVVVLTNSENMNPSALAFNVAAVYVPGLIPERIAKNVDPKVFDAYVGKYQPNPQIVVTVAREGNKLMIQMGPNEKQELVPESETDFFLQENRRFTYSFVKDEKGQVTHMVVKREGTETGRAKRLD
jgi:hypothetical protein